VREAYQERLSGLAAVLGDMCTQVAAAMDDATRALLETDLGWPSA
jgi:hypothetical protein